MVNVRQLELNLEVAFEEAAEIPETADVLSLWAQFEGELAGLGQRDRLRVGGRYPSATCGTLRGQSRSALGGLAGRA